MITGATITGPKGTMRGRAGQGRLFLEQVLLHRGPARAAEFLGPAVAQPALLAKDLGPALHVVAGQVQGVVHLVRDLLRKVGAHPGADLLAELLFFRGECKVHGMSPEQSLI
jgi:hypothetical protein